jgi:hypothetical protein
MPHHERLCLWLIAVAIPPFVAMIGLLISFSVGGTPSQGLVGGSIFGLLADGIYIPLLRLCLEKYKPHPAPGAATPPASVTPAPLSPDVTSQINDIVNSGREPALIVEELRRLTEARP